ncbi:MAG: EAL domain-containing protein [Chloroflexi bacterium]|nr:EAL domain-containing protein [Chloroflexota bacterium]
MSASPITLPAPRRISTRLGPHPTAIARLVLGTVGVLAFAGSTIPALQDAILLVVNGGSAVALFVGIRRRRPAARRAWLAIAAAMALYTLADALVWLAPTVGEPMVGAIGEALYVVGYPLFFAAAIRFAAGARRLDSVVLLDTAIIGVGTALLVWESLVESRVPAELASAAALTAMAYPIVATLLVTLVLPLVLTRQTRSMSGLLLVIGLACIGVADTTYALDVLGNGRDLMGALSHPGWLLGSFCLGASGFVPSAAQLGRVGARPTVRRDAFRFVALALALVVPPVLIFLEVSRGETHELQAYAVVAIVLAGLVIVRLQRSVAAFVESDERFRRFMGHDGFLAVSKDGQGHYTYMNETAERATPVSPGGWYGRTDAEIFAPEVAARRLVADQAVRETGESTTEMIELDGRTWLVERFPMPSNHGSIGVLGLEVTGQIRAEQRLWAAEQRADRWARERALIVETLEALDVGRTPEDTAEAICARIIRLPEVALASIATFGVDGGATIIGQVTTRGQATPGLPLSPERSEYLRMRAAAGPWVERWVAPPGHPYEPLLTALGVRAHAFAPMTTHGEVAGVLIVGSGAPDAMDRLIERLPAVAEFAQVASALLGPQLVRRLAIARTGADVRELIEHTAFEIAFQPIVELATRQVGGYEALARFRDGCPPDEQFRLAHEVGLGTELELACVRVALRDAARLERGAWLNVNVSPAVVLSGALEALLPLPDRVVVLEVTEHEAISDYAAFRAAVARLDGGVRVAVDDAGAGFASLRHIVELDPLFVKLDRSLVAGIGTDPARQAIVAGMVHFAEAAHLTLVAEGIETEEELAALMTARVPLGQGYLLGRPELLAGRPN